MNTYAILRRNGWKSPEELQEAAERSTKVGNEEMADEVRWIRSYVLEEGEGVLRIGVLVKECGQPPVKLPADIVRSWLAIQIHSLARIGLLSSLPGETLHKLADRMRREEVDPGTVVLREGEPGDRFYVLLSGVAGVSQQTRGPRGVIRPGDWFGEVALAMGVPRTATVTAMTPCVVASCDRATFDELLRPLFADDDDAA